VKSGLTKNRARRSGAAKRRYNKQQWKGRAGSAQTPPSATESPATLPAGGGEGAGAGASKRARSEHTTPSPSEDRRGKILNVTPDQGSYAQATKGLIRMALVLEGYPDKKLGADKAREVRRLVRGRILMLPDAPAPTFTGSWERDSVLVFCCANQGSADWLKSLSGEIKIGGVSLRALPAELPKTSGGGAYGGA